MGDVIDFQRPAKPAEPAPLTFYGKFKDVIRQHYAEHDVHLVVAAIHDKDCYDRASPEVRAVVDLYNRFSP
jgi:hypothetical protein